MAIRFGFILPAGPSPETPRATFVASLDRALERVAGHFDSAWCIDHLQAGEAGQLEGFTTLTYLAARHPQLTFGHTVVCQSFRNPALLAQMGATLHYLSGGRFVLGIGAGWNREEYRAYGYDFPPAGVRVDQLDEAIQIVKALWAGSPATFVGRHYRVEGARCEPRLDPPPPLMVGAFGPRMLRLTARHADWWNASSTGPTEYRRLSQALDDACRAQGRAPRSIRRTWSGGCACSATQARAEAIAGDLYSATAEGEDFGFVGTPVQIIAQIQRFVDLGVDYFMVDCGGFPDLTTLDLMVSDVLPAFVDVHSTDQP